MSEAHLHTAVGATALAAHLGPGPATDWYRVGDRLVAQHRPPDMPVGTYSMFSLSALATDEEVQAYFGGIQHGVDNVGYGSYAPWPQRVRQWVRRTFSRSAS